MSNIDNLLQPHKSLLELAQSNARGAIAEYERQLGMTLPDRVKELVERCTIEETFVPNKILRPGHKLDNNMIRILCTTRAEIMSPMSDIMKYYNDCLNDEQRHQVMTNLFINSLSDVLHPATNPYTGQFYKESDVTYDDTYVALFFAKLSQLNNEDATQLKLRLAVLMGSNVTKLFDFLSFDALMDEIQTQAYNAYTFLITVEELSSYSKTELSKLKAVQSSLSLLESIAAETTNEE